jgi:hypothetical protein
VIAQRQGNRGDMHPRFLRDIRQGDPFIAHTGLCPRERFGFKSIVSMPPPLLPAG